MANLSTWPDVSEHNNKPIDHTVNTPFIGLRVCDGTYVDELFHMNLSRVAVLKQLYGFLAYVCYPRSVGSSSWQAVYETVIHALGNFHRPKMVIMQDVESWERLDLHKDHSADIEAQRVAFVKWLNSVRPSWQRSGPLAPWYRMMDNRRVIGYGNRSDLMTMASRVHWQSVILADYSNEPTPGKLNGWRVIARQYTDRAKYGPWPVVDFNRSDLAPWRVARALGLGSLLYLPR